MCSEKNLICRGFVSHQRLLPKKHAFRYRSIGYLLDLDSLAAESSWLFGYNKRRVFSLWDKDYLVPGTGQTVKEKLHKFLLGKGETNLPDRIQLLTNLRFFGYVFNPASFFYCYRGEKLQQVVVEINNTFGERHLYLLSAANSTAENEHQISYCDKKTFHVSPFYDLLGDYHYCFGKNLQRPVISIDKSLNGKKHFYSLLNFGQTFEFNTYNLLGSLVKAPMTAVLTYPRILYQAALMYYVKSLPVFRKPRPASTDTVKFASESATERFARNQVLRQLSKLPFGSIRLTLPDNQVVEFAAKEHPELGTIRAEIIINRWNFFSSLLRHGAVGLGESYTNQSFTAPDLKSLLRYFTANLAIIKQQTNWLAKIAGIKNYLGHFLKRNTLGGARNNISAHYDLSNDFFSLFLDPSLAYSCAVYRNAEEDLAAAQANKFAQIAELAELKPGQHVLEIGSGWGSQAIYLAKNYGVTVKTITISVEQFNHVQAEILRLGLQSQISVHLQDYRELTEQEVYDAVISVEMVEAIGKSNYQSYFTKIEQTLKAGSKSVIQFISAPDQRYRYMQKNCDWIQKYIFPGSLIPSMQVLLAQIGKTEHLKFEAAISIGPDYSLTLDAWQHNFASQLRAVRGLGFSEEFINTWNYYLAYCSVAFETKVLDVQQMVLHKSRLG